MTCGRDYDFLGLCFEGRIGEGCRKGLHSILFAGSFRCDFGLGIDGFLFLVGRIVLVDSCGSALGIVLGPGISGFSKDRGGFLGG